MTVSSELSRKTFAMDAATTSFGTSPVVFFDSSDLEVYVVTEATGAATLLTENTHYTVTGGDGSTGTVDTSGGSSPYGAGSSAITLVISRVLPLTQEIDPENNDGSDANVAERVFDRQVMISQQIQSQVDRSFKLADSDVSGASTELPTPEASTLIGWNDAGTALANYASGDLASTILVSSFMETVLDDATALDARTTLGVQTSALTEDAAPDVLADFVHTYDTSGAALKKARPVLLAVPTPSAQLRNGYVEWSVAGGALTAAIKTLAGTDPSATDPVFALMRNATVTDGKPYELKITAALSQTVSSGSTLGTRSAIPCNIWCAIFDDGGTARLGLINCLTTVAGAGSGSNVTAIYPLRGFGVASATSEGGAGAADSAQTFYSGAAITSKAYSVLGYAYFAAGQATAGTWATAPTREHLQRQGDPLPGDVIQFQGNATGAVATGTTVTPIDDSIPQITEGDQYLTQAITPSSAANVLDITSVTITASSAAAGTTTTALHQDAVANALAAVPTTFRAANDQLVNYLRHLMLAATVAATTLRIRAGAGAAGTTTFNGLASARLLGDVSNSFLHVREIQA